jgi:hypothetical protein
MKMDDPAPTITIVNQTQGSVLAERCELAHTFWKRFLGLMGRTPLDPGTGLIIYPEWSIHTFFMRFPIDVLFLDRHDTIVGLREAMPPNRPFAGVRGARYVIELPPGQIAATQTQIGHHLDLTPSPHPHAKH